MPSLTYDPVDTSVSPGALPRAQGASFTPAVGEAIEHVGLEGSRLAGDMNRINYQQRMSDGITSIKQNIMSADEQFTGYMEQQKANMPINGAGYVDAFKSKFDDWNDQFVSQYQDPKLRKIAQEQAATLHNRFYNQAASWQIGTNRAWRINTFHSSIQNDWNALDKDPSQLDQLKRDQLQSIDMLGGDIHPEDRITLSNLVNNTYGNAAAMSWARTHPQETVNAILGTTPAVSDSMTGKIVGAAQSVTPQARNAGLSPNVALAVANIENDTYDPTRKPPATAGNPNPTATGLFQMIDGTWAEKGGTPENRLDPNMQAQLGVQNLADNTRALSDSLRRPLSPGEVYSTQLGLGFAGALAKAPDNVPIRSVFAQAGLKDPDSAAAANGLASMTAGQVRAHYETLMRDRMAKTAGLSMQSDPASAETAKASVPGLSDLTPTQLQSVLSHAQSNLRHDDAGEKVSLNQDFNDIKSAYVSGQDPLRQWDPSRALKVDGPVEGARKNNEILQAQWFGHATSQLNTAGPAQQAAIIKDADEKMGATAPGSYGYHQAKAYSDALHSAAANVNNLRVHDQVGEDQKTLQLTKPLDTSNPDFLGAQLNARYAQAHVLQDTWGMKDYKPVSLEEADRFTDFLSKGEPSQIVQYLAQARVSAGEKQSDYSALLQQISPKAPLTAVAGAVAPFDAPMAQAILTGAHMTKDAKDLGIGVDPKLIESRWALEQGRAFGQWTDNSRLTLDAVKAAYTAMLPADRRDNKSIDDDTWNNVTKRISPVVDFNGPTLVPIGMNHDQFVSNVAARYTAALTKAGYDPAEYRMNTVKLIPDPKTDGVYQVYSGLTPIRGAVIDLNTPPDTNFTPVSMEGQTTSAEFQRQMARKNPTFGTSKY